MSFFPTNLASPGAPHRFTGAGFLLGYFRSGWAFLLPYLAVYLVYAWLKLPVNPVVTPSPSGMGPCLLHLYWALHAIHLMLGLAALRAWWRSPGGALEATGPVPARDRLYALLPWLCLALLFWLPGLYLEWPSDPWEHLRRINEWRIQDMVTAHSYWLKSSYFLPYSLTGFITGLAQLSWLNFYYTAVCLLLSWQYYRLARAVGLGSRASFVFVSLNAITFGNNIFSFYRYYGLSSSILAQLGAVALTRIVVECFSHSRSRAKSEFLKDDGPRPPATDFYSRPALLQSVGAGLVLLLLIAFNHIQGIGISALGVLAVIAWRLNEWKRSMSAYLITAMIALSIATVLWLPRHPAVDEVYRSRGWLTAWYGFNLFSPSSPAFDRSLQILGVFGVLNLVLGFWLILRKNHLAGWLTLMPVLVLSLPCFALPFTQVLAAQTNADSSILSFHRLLFAIPLGLAVVVAISELVLSIPTLPWWKQGRASFAPAALTCILAVLTVTSPSSAIHNRVWHFLGRLSHDAISHDIVSDATNLLHSSPLGSQVGYQLILGEPLDYTFASIGIPRPSTPDNRRIGNLAINYSSARAARLVEKLSIPPTLSAVYLPDRLMAFSAISQAAVLSRHWLPQEIPLAGAGITEVDNALAAHPTTRLKIGHHLQSSALVLQEPHPPVTSLIVLHGLRLNYYNPQSALPLVGDSLRWLPFRRNNPSRLVGTVAPGGPHFFTRSGHYKFKLHLLPAEGGADLLLNIDTPKEQNAIYLIHHRSNNRYYYYIGRNEIGPWSPTNDSMIEAEFAWADGKQTLAIGGVIVLQSALPITSELITRISIGSDPERLARALHGDILIENLMLYLSQAP